jgi:hypothetical protein
MCPEVIALTLIKLIFQEYSTMEYPQSFFPSAIPDFDHQNGNDIAPLQGPNRGTGRNHRKNIKWVRVFTLCPLFSI